MNMSDLGSLFRASVGSPFSGPLLSVIRPPPKDPWETLFHTLDVSNLAPALAYGTVLIISGVDTALQGNGDGVITFRNMLP